MPATCSCRPRCPAGPPRINDLIRTIGGDRCRPRNRIIFSGGSGEITPVSGRRKRLTSYRLHYFPESGNSYKIALMLTLVARHSSQSGRTSPVMSPSRKLPRTSFESRRAWHRDCARVNSRWGDYSVRNPKNIAGVQENKEPQNPKGREVIRDPNHLRGQAPYKNSRRTA